MDLRKEIFLLAKKEMDDGSNVLLELCTGFGKTKTSIDLCEDHGMKNVTVLVPTDAIALSWAAEIKKWKSNISFTMVNYLSAHRILESLIPPDCVLLDEAHHVTERNLEYISKIKCPLIALSATVDWEKMQLLKTLGFKRGIVVDLDKASEHDLVAPYEMNVITFPFDTTTNNMLAGTKQEQWYTTEAKSLAYAESRIGNAKKTRNSKSIEFAYMNRMRLIRTLPSRIELAKKMIVRLRAKYPNSKILVFAPDIARCEELVPECFFHSKSGPEGFDAFKAGTEPVLGSVNALSEGINVHADIAIIVAGMSQERTLIQRLGRLLRKTAEGKIGMAFMLVCRGTQDEVWAANSTASLSNIRNFKSEDFGL